MNAPGSERLSITSRFLKAIERIGNMLPHPVTLFAIFAVWTVLLVIWMITGLPLGPGGGLYLAD